MKRIEDKEWKRLMDIVRATMGYNPTYYEYDQFISKTSQVLETFNYNTAEFQTIAWELWYNTKEEPNNGHG